MIYEPTPSVLQRDFDSEHVRFVGASQGVLKRSEYCIKKDSGP